LASGNLQDRQNNNKVNNVLKFFNSEPLSSDKTQKTGDQIDAIISAAAIRHLADKPKTWNPDGLTDCARTYGGWIFGVL